MTWPVTIRAINAAACQACHHRVGDHSAHVGCQHLEPVRDDWGYLVRHDRCKCRVSVGADRTLAE